MPHFKDSLNNLYSLSDSDIQNGGIELLPVDCVQISDEEASAIQAANTPLPDPIEEKKTAILKASEAALKSGALNRVLWGIIEMTIIQLMSNPVVVSAHMTREQVIDALITESSPFYNEDFSKTYQQYNTLKALIDGDTA